MKIIFMGTPDFAVPTFQKLIDNGYCILGAFTQPDKPVGRKQHELVFSPVKSCAIKNNIKIFQPTTLRSDEVIGTIKALEPDAIVVAAYGKILPKEVLNIPKYGCINVHGSLLPKYRGAAPIQRSIINGEKVTGITTMLMDEGLDTGDILLAKEIEILEDDTSESLFKKMSHAGANLLIETIKLLENNKLIRIKQDELLASYSGIIKKIDAKIDWNKLSKEVYNLIRGMNPWPIAYTYIKKNKLLKIYKAKISDMPSNIPGEVLNINPLIISCGGGTSLELSEVQLEGKKRIKAEEFTRGYKILKNDLLGDRRYS
ncbi:MAG: methionyl-tRNA formyltransferase [Oscillospiraceae bacterium]|jgi:methionyl-tRNA formyltransferase|nr:methionyl-tRNA formyltransferase [Oscillospiraceae bacterium]